MDVGDVTPWLGIGSGGWGIFLLVRDNFRLRGENKDLRGADKRASAAEAEVAGLSVRVGDLTDEVIRLRKQLEEFMATEGGAGHA